ncbi:N(4)-acetylcytidine aminohydrolase [Klebsiella pneumoniae]|nr:N(4)-acetylcytidine aminohydrolase [Klebsiella pneumoniae]
MTLPFFSVFRTTSSPGAKPSPFAMQRSHFKPGDVLRVGRYEDDGYFCTIAVTATSTVTLDTLTEQHAQQENMTLGQLRQVISDIYPGESQFYVIEFKTL